MSAAVDLFMWWDSFSRMECGMSEMGIREIDIEDLSGDSTRDLCV
jgi:hypothetical protein